MAIKDIQNSISKLTDEDFSSLLQWIPTEEQKRINAFQQD